MRIFFDTEFDSTKPAIEPISLGAVQESGAAFYCEFADYNRATANLWLQRHVLDQCNGPKVSVGEFRYEFETFCGKSPEFWTYCGGHDYVVLCSLYGGMFGLPKDWPPFVMDINNVLVMNGWGEWNLPHQKTRKHHALNDALWVKDCYAALQALKESRKGS